ncbi:uncharacterized protein M421DRAFT_302964 [Didymella exigua CBS 183.55]|uniref:Rhodopsin domain-containing protein n=1 Tax=Didymella exigua CBS 183.55 TaxID=1150837 RepID=A0A6A5R931_9PLEO|nr:uncharacterized protein M421DRAFT_302964 [Didymella exigua CBS 183.55]KAF1923839.1 hypothetical protein M421DRAFT_302964 [Didymella exigua CBS 183.55]
MTSPDTAPLTGQEIASAAYVLPPLQPQGLSLGIVAVSILLAIITLLVACLRIWVRLGLLTGLTRVWKTEDYLFVLALVPFIPSVVWAIIAVHYGVGLRDADLPSSLYAVRAGEYIVYWEVMYFVSSTLIKSAIGFTCIRIDQRKRVTYPVLLNIFIMWLTAALALMFVFVNCRPLAATWNPALGTCQQMISLETVSYIVSAVQALTDWVSAFVPCYIVSKLQMPRRTKITIVFILGLGILASIATIIRLPYLKYYNTAKYPKDFLFHVGVIVMCSNAECSLGIIACSLPPLRKLLKMFYEHWSSYKRGAQDYDVRNSGMILGPLHPQSDGLSSTRAAARNEIWHTLDNDDSSRKGILQ